MEKIQHDINTVFVSPWWFMGENPTREAERAEDETWLKLCSHSGSSCIQQIVQQRASLSQLLWTGGEQQMKTNNTHQSFYNSVIVDYTATILQLYSTEAATQRVSTLTCSCVPVCASCDSQPQKSEIQKSNDVPDIIEASVCIDPAGPAASELLLSHEIDDTAAWHHSEARYENQVTSSVIQTQWKCLNEGATGGAVRKEFSVWLLFTSFLWPPTRMWWCNQTVPLLSLIISRFSSLSNDMSVSRAPPTPSRIQTHQLTLVQYRYQNLLGSAKISSMCELKEKKSGARHMTPDWYWSHRLEVLLLVDLLTFQRWVNK